MSIQTLSPHDPATNGERIQVPSPSPAPPTPPPSLLTVFAREAWRRKGLLFIWALATGALTAAAVLHFARPVYRAEGKLSYIPNYKGGMKSVYTPPNIQTAIQILKAPEVLDTVRERHLPDMSKDDFTKAVRVEIAKQSELIDVSFDHPDQAVATAVASDLISESVKHFDSVRTRTTKEAVAQVTRDLKKANEDLEKAKADFHAAAAARGVNDLEADRKAIEAAIGGIETQILLARHSQSDLKVRIEYLEAKRDAPPGPEDKAIDDSKLAQLQTQMQQLQAELLNEEAVEKAKISLDLYKARELQYRPLIDKVITRSEYDDVVAQIKAAEATIERYKKKAERLKELTEIQENLRRANKDGKPVRREVISELARFKSEAAGIPARIQTLELELAAKKRERDKLIALDRDLGPLTETITLTRDRVKDFSAQLTDAGQRSKDLNADDLKVHAPASTGGTPYSSNASKVGLAIVGTSALLFIGYMVLFALPKLVPTGADGLAGPDGRVRSRALIALVPFAQASNPPASGAVANGQATGPTPARPDPAYTQAEPSVPVTPSADVDTGHAHANGMSPAAAVATDTAASPIPVRRIALNALKPPTPAPKATPAAKPAVAVHSNGAPEGALRALAERIAEEGVDRGGIVLFAPTADQLRVACMMGDLGQHLTQNGDRVLVFDARPAAETPGWAGPDAPSVAASVEGYLDGRSAAPADCFVPTSLNGVEYSRADLSGRVCGVIAAHRFRQLVEEMRERYSLVLMVSPAITLDGGDPLLATLAEGMVLVTESTADPESVHAFIETFSRQVPAPVYGTLAVPRA